MIYSYNKLPDVHGGHKSNISLKFEALTTLHLADTMLLGALDTIACEIV